MPLSARAAADELGIARPAYDGGSIVNLMASIVAASGGTPRYAPLDGLDAARLERARHIVLIVVDGLGDELLGSSRAGATLRGLRERTITSVYPPTTATAITTFLTGLAPQQHGLTGWFMYFEELGDVVAVLPFTTRAGGEPLAAAGVTAESLLGHATVFEQIERAAFCVSPREIADSEFNRAHTRGAELHRYTTLDGFVDAIGASVRAAQGPSYVYAYWPVLDRLAHEHGSASGAVHGHLAELDAAYARLLARLEGTDTLVLLTADHGFVDIEAERIVDVADHAPLRDMLAMPLCGEPRTAYCYVAAGHGARFDDYVARELADTARCVESGRLLEAGWFGPGEPHARLAGRIGDYTLLMRAGYAVRDSVPGEQRFAPIGMHGGGSAAELNVPLIVAET